MITLLESYVANPIINNIIKSRAVMLLVGLASDEKPLVKFNNIEIENGSSFIEIDTSKFYKYNQENNEWIEQNEISGGGEGTSIIIDSELSSTSTNPVQNRTIFLALDGKAGTTIATQSVNGLMSAQDKIHLDDVYNDYSSMLEALGVI